MQPDDVAPGSPEDWLRHARSDLAIARAMHVRQARLMRSKRLPGVLETLGLILDLAHTARLEHAIERMFAGEHINTTEGRAVLHTALRNRGAEAVIVDGADVMPSVRMVLARMRAFSEGVHSGEYRGMSGAPFTDVVNIGIGGSHLGPLLVTRALRPYQKGGLRVHFVSNVDPADIAETLAVVGSDLQNA